MIIKMTDYYIFLRGINAGGHHKVPMEELREVLREAGYENIRTVLNSGNVGLEFNETSLDKLETTLEASLESTFGFPIPVMAREADRIHTLLVENPFQQASEKAKWLVTFLKNPVLQHEEEWDSAGMEIVHHAPDLVCWMLDLDTTGTPDGMKVMEGWYGKKTTTRTWQTLQKLVRK